MFWKHPITKKNRFLPVVHATNGIPSYFDHDLSKTSTWLMEIFMHPAGSNRVHGLILGLVFQVGGLGLTGTRVMSP